MAGMLDLRTKRQKVTGLAVGSAWTPAAGLVSASSWAPVRNRRRRLAPCSMCSPPAPALALAGGHARDWAEERTNAGGEPRRPAGRLPLEKAVNFCCAAFRGTGTGTEQAVGARHRNWTFSGQLIFGQFPRKIVPGIWDAYTAKETENRQGEVGFLRYSPYGP
jgi:hypothetical protein